MHSDTDAEFDTEIHIDATELEPYVSWGTNPGQTLPVTSSLPSPDDFEQAIDRDSAKRALEYMGLEAGTAITAININKVFVGSCTNGRIEDLRAAAKIVEGHEVSASVSAIVVPGSGLVKLQAESEGLASRARWKLSTASSNCPRRFRA